LNSEYKNVIRMANTALFPYNTVPNIKKYIETNCSI